MNELDKRKLKAYILGMALISLGNNVVDMRRSLGGVYFTRDKSGLHCTAMPRMIKRRTAAQDRQRRAFSTARAYSFNNRTVSYNIYRALNNLRLREPPMSYPQVK